LTILPKAQSTELLFIHGRCRRTSLPQKSTSPPSIAHPMFIPWFSFVPLQQGPPTLSRNAISQRSALSSSFSQKTRTSSSYQNANSTAVLLRSAATFS
jgi:hypothetical protein